MHTIIRSLGVGAVAAGFLATLSAPTMAGGARHEIYIEEFDETYAIDAEENACGPWPARIHEVRSGAYKLVTAPGGRVDGEMHVNGVVHGWVAIDPDRGGPLPTYTGTYREKANGVVLADDGERVSQYRLRTVARATDGGTLVLILKGKLTVNANGRVTSEHDLRSCDID